MSRRFFAAIRWLCTVYQSVLACVPHPRSNTLYITIAEDGKTKLGTCKHCVLEPGRPARSWEAQGDRELDFPRDALLEQLATYGLQVDIEQQYICP